MTPSLDESKEFVRVREIRVTKLVLKTELNLGIRGRHGKPLPRGRGGGSGRGWGSLTMEGPTVAESGEEAVFHGLGETRRKAICN